jgi:excisionase family DNA binding protein
VNQGVPQATADRKIETLGSGFPLSNSAATIEPRYLSIKQASTYSGACIWHIRKLIWGKKIRAVRLGRRLVLDRLELDSYLSGAAS